MASEKMSACGVVRLRAVRRRRPRDFRRHEPHGPAVRRQVVTAHSKLGVGLGVVLHGSQTGLTPCIEESNIVGQRLARPRPIHAFAFPRSSNTKVAELHAQRRREEEVRGFYVPASERRRSRNLRRETRDARAAAATASRRRGIDANE